MGRPTLYHQKALEVLANGEWHDYLPVMRKVAKAVPPGVAYRAMETSRKVSIRTRLGLGPDDPIPERNRSREMSDAVLSGQRHVARICLGNKRRFERKGDQIRLIPKREFSQEERLEIAARSRKTLLDRYGPDVDKQLRAKGNATRKANNTDPREAMRKTAARMTPEQKSERSRRGWESRRAGGWTYPGSSLTPEQRSEITRKSWETRRRKKAEGGD